jgi:hypothetical protein
LGYHGNEINKPLHSNGYVLIDAHMGGSHNVIREAFSFCNWAISTRFCIAYRAMLHCELKINGELLQNLHEPSKLQATSYKLEAAQSTGDDVALPLKTAAS